ncbi:MAG: leucyl/phenylalanyl-tRNA--protein transferase, partial [Bacteroidota bacterium]
RKQRFRITLDQDFPQVIRACKDIYRAGQNGTWISDELEASYIALHEEGIAHSLEVWEGNRLVGGLYGELLGRMFFGESMFSRESNASKIGFLTLVKNFVKQGIGLIDCQIHSNYLESMGATHIPRKEFLTESSRRQQQPFDFESFKESFRQDAEWILG